MTDKELTKYMDGLYQGTKEKKVNMRAIIASAVQLGMKYQEDKIKAGIDIVFNELHNKK